MFRTVGNYVARKLDRLRDMRVFSDVGHHVNRLLGQNMICVGIYRTTNVRPI